MGKYQFQEFKAFIQLFQPSTHSFITARGLKLSLLVKYKRCVLAVNGLVLDDAFPQLMIYSGVTHGLQLYRVDMKT